MDWFFFLIISIVTFSIANLLQRVLMKREQSNTTLYTLVFQCVCVLMILTFALIHGFVMPPITTHPIPFLLVGPLYGCMNLFLFTALKTEEASKVTVLLSSRAFWTIIAALLFLGESFSLQKAFGTFCIISAVFLVTWKTKGISFGKGSIYALIAALLFGLAIANDAYLLRFSDAYSYTVVSFLLSTSVVALANPKNIFRIPGFVKKPIFVKVFFLSFFYITSATTFALGLQAGGTASQMTPIMQSASILTVIAAAIFLKERDRLPIKFLAVILVSIGVFLLR